MTENKNVSIELPGFSGQDESVSWFLDQIIQMKALFGCSDEIALLALKGKLTGSAKEFVANNPKFHKANFMDTIKFLREFFEETPNPFH